MRTVKLSPVRRFLLAWFDPSRSVPYVSANVSINFLGARRYLEQLAAKGEKVTVQALLTATLGRLYAEFPQINRRVIGRRVYQCPDVGVAVPVNLLGHGGGEKMELSVLLLPAVDRLSLVQVAQRLSGDIRDERAGKPKNPLVRVMLSVASYAPDSAIELALKALHLVHDTPAMASVSWWSMPASVGMSNPGAAVSGTSGIWVRAASLNLPTYPLQVGSLLGVSIVQDEVVAIDGRPEVRPMLPVTYIFDHRLIDGVMAGRILTRFAEMLQDPALLFGDDGRTSV